MKVKHRLTYICFLISGFLLGCSDSEEPGSSGPFLLNEMLIQLDGSTVATITLSGFESEREGNTFFYRDGGEKEGEWSIGEDGNTLMISYESEELNLPILANVDGILTIEAASIDLTQTSFSDLEQKILLTANQRLLQDGQGLAQFLTGANELKVLFTLNN